MAPRGHRDCDSGVRAGRKTKATQFWRAAGIIETLAEDEADLVDAYVTLLIHAGIAASDVICCARLGYHPMSENHALAVKTLGTIDKARAGDLATLLGVKTKAGYTHTPISTTDRTRAKRAAEHLIDAMNEL